MYISVDDLISYHKKFQFPLINQSVNIIQKYQEFTGKSIDHSQKFKALHFEYDADDKMNFTKIPESLSRSIYDNESKIVDKILNYCEIEAALSDLGIQSNSYTLIYIYHYVNTYKDHYEDAIILELKNLAMLVVFFEESSYNLLRLAWNENNAYNKLQLNFDLDYDFTN